MGSEVITNHLSPNGFHFSIDNDKFKNLEFHIFNGSIPSISMPGAAAPYKNNYGFVPGDTIDYGDISWEYIVDEEMNNYFAAIEWLRDTKQYGPEKSHDILLYIYTNHNNLNRIIRFVSAFPINVGEISLQTNVSSIQYITNSIDIKYDYFIME